MGTGRYDIIGYCKWNNNHYNTTYISEVTVYNKTQGSYMSGRVKFKAFSRTFKAMYQEIQGPMG